MEQLVIRLGSNVSDPVHWLVWSKQEDEIIASGELPDAQQLHTLAERAGTRAITALIPAGDVYLKWVNLPVKAGRKALSAIPFMLEDELSEDISLQFFALGVRKDNQQAVAVVTRQKMQRWLNMIAEAGLQCDKMLPDVLALPHSEQCWSLLSLGKHLLVRQDEWQGIQGSSDWILPAIEHYAKQQTEALHLDNYSDQELPQLANVKVEQQPLDMPMQVLAKGALNNRFNLLQGDFKIKRKSTGGFKQWRWAAALAALALVTTLIDKGIELNQLSTEKAALTDQIESEFKRAFPQTRRISGRVRSQMRQQLATLEQSGGSVSMLAILSQLTDAFSSSNVKPQTLRFDSSRAELRIQAVANNFESLEQFKRLAEQSGFEVQQGAINNKDDQVIGSLTIRS